MLKKLSTSAAGLLVLLTFNKSSLKNGDLGKSVANINNQVCHFLGFSQR
jgi:hypothetical protein